MAILGYKWNVSLKTETVRARIEPELKQNAEQIFSEIGITTSEAIKMFFKQVEISGGIPFALKAPIAKALPRGKKPSDFRERLRDTFGDKMIAGDAIQDLIEERDRQRW